MKEADCNRDEHVTVSDALGTVNAILGIRECEPWVVETLLVPRS